MFKKKPRRTKRKQKYKKNQHHIHMILRVVLYAIRRILLCFFSLLMLVTNTAIEFLRGFKDSWSLANSTMQKGEDRNVR